MVLVVDMLTVRNHEIRLQWCTLFPSWWLHGATLTLDVKIAWWKLEDDGIETHHSPIIKHNHQHRFQVWFVLTSHLAILSTYILEYWAAMAQRIFHPRLIIIIKMHNFIQLWFYDWASQLTLTSTTRFYSTPFLYFKEILLKPKSKSQQFHPNRISCLNKLHICSFHQATPAMHSAEIPDSWFYSSYRVELRMFANLSKHR